MHKRQQAKTKRARKKGYKLKNLTKQEAVLRAKKAWVTRHQRYGLHKVEGEGHYKRSSRQKKTSGQADSERLSGIFGAHGSGHIVTEDELAQARMEAAQPLKEETYARARKMAEHDTGQNRLSKLEHSRLTKEIQTHENQEEWLSVYTANYEAIRSQQMGRRDDEGVGDRGGAQVRQFTSRLGHMPRDEDIEAGINPEWGWSSGPAGMKSRRQAVPLSRKEAEKLYFEELKREPGVAKLLSERHRNLSPQKKKESEELEELVKTIATTMAATRYSPSGQARITAKREAERRATRLSQKVSHDIEERSFNRKYKQAQSSYFPDDRLVEGWARQETANGVKWNRVVVGSNKINTVSGHHTVETHHIQEIGKDGKPGKYRTEKKSGQVRFVPINDLRDPSKDLPWGVNDPREKEIGFTSADLHHAYQQDSESRKERFFGQGRMLRDQTINRVKGHKEGRTPIYVDENGRRTHDPKKAKFSVTPNKQYEYTLRHRNEPGVFTTQNIAHDDKTTRVRKENLYDSTGQLKEGKFDPIVRVREKQVFDTAIRDVNVGKVETIKGEGLNWTESYNPATKRLKPHSYNAPNIQHGGGVGRQEGLFNEYKGEIIGHAPVGGVHLGERTAIKTRDLPKGIDQEILVPMSGITKRSHKDIPSKKYAQDKQLLKENDIRTHNKTRITYVPASEWQTKSGEEDRAYVAFKNRTFSYAPEEGSVAHTVVTGTSRAKQERLRREASQQKHDDLMNRIEFNRKMQGNDSFFDHRLRGEIHAREQVESDPAKDEASWKEHERANSKMHDLYAAAGAAVYYGQRKKVREETVPKIKNKFYRAATQNKYTKPYAQRMKFKETWGDVQEGVQKPLVEKAQRQAWKAFRPFQSESGVTPGGIDYGRFRYRQHWFAPWQNADDVIASRKLERQRKGLVETYGSKKFFEKNSYSKNFARRLVAKQQEGVLRQDEYKNFDWNLTNELQNLGHIRATGTGKVQKEAEKSYKILDDVRQAHFKPQNDTKDWLAGGHKLELELAKGMKSTSGSHTGRNVAIVGALAATAIGAHYLYHRHEEAKKAEGDRTAYYNKVLPKPVTVRRPKVRVVKSYQIPTTPLTHELNLEQRKIPLRFGARLEKHTYNFRPSDKGYDKNQRLIGNIKGGGPRGKGSLYGSVSAPYAAERKRSYKRGSHELYIKGKKAPLYINIEKPESPELTGKNPARITQGERESIVKATANTNMEKKVRDFYWDDQEMQHMFDEARINTGILPHQRAWINEEARRTGNRREALRKQSQEDWRGKKAKLKPGEIGKSKEGRARGGYDTEYRGLGDIHPIFRDKHWNDPENVKARRPPTGHQATEHGEGFAMAGKATNAEIEDAINTYKEKRKNLPPHWLFPRDW